MKSKAIISATKACIASYALATQQGGNVSVPTTQVASGLASHYLANFTSFTLGAQTVFPDEPFAAASTAAYLQRLRDKGIGTDIELKRYKVHPVSELSSLAWVTWMIRPWEGSGLGEWDFVDVYGFRVVEGGRENGLEGGWEYVNADDEFLELFERVPDFYS